MTSSKGDHSLSKLNETEQYGITGTGNFLYLRPEHLHNAGIDHLQQLYNHDITRQNAQVIQDFVASHGGAFGLVNPSDSYIHQQIQHYPSENLSTHIRMDSTYTTYNNLQGTLQNQILEMDISYPQESNNAMYPGDNSNIYESARDTSSEQKSLYEIIKENKFSTITDEQLNRNIDINLHQSILLQEIMKGSKKQMAHESSVWHYLANNGTDFMSDEIKNKARLIRDSYQNNDFSRSVENWKELKLLLTLNEKGATKTTKETYMLIMDILNRQVSTSDTDITLVDSSNNERIKQLIEDYKKLSWGKEIEGKSKATVLAEAWVKHKNDGNTGLPPELARELKSCPPDNLTPFYSIPGDILKECGNKNADSNRKTFLKDIREVFRNNTENEGN